MPMPNRDEIRRSELCDEIITQAPGKATLEEWRKFAKYLDWALKEHEEDYLSNA